MKQKPPRETAPKTTSFFEFWPLWLMYLPVMVMWPIWAFRYRSFTLPFIANPHVTLSAMVGASKHEIFKQFSEKPAAILPWICFEKTSAPLETQIEQLRVLLKQNGIALPLVCKPDMGCRGAGVKCIKDDKQLESTLAAYPIGAKIVYQQLASYQDEVGIFYVRHPGHSSGEIVSLTFKQRPSVTGDGIHTVAELLHQDPRAAQHIDLYQPRNQAIWHQVLPDGKVHDLIFSATHSRGAVFVDARAHITEALTEAIDTLMQQLPDFHYGRLDVKYADLTALKQGKTLEVLEINGASAEAIHIWDKNTTLWAAFSTLIWQYQTLFAIGDKMRQRGHRSPTPMTLYRAWQQEKILSAQYPDTD